MDLGFIRGFLAGAAWQRDRIIRMMKEKALEFINCEDFERQTIGRNWALRADWLERELSREETSND